jgi:AraC-like DNA-binding protein
LLQQENAPPNLEAGFCLSLNDSHALKPERSMSDSRSAPHARAKRAAAAPSRATAVKLWRAPDVLDAVMLKGEFVGHRYPPHAHDTHCLVLITSGSVVVDIAGHVDTLRRGDIVALDADTMHAAHAGESGSWKMRVAYFLPDDLAAYTGSIGLPVRSRLDVRAAVIRDAPLAQSVYGVNWCSEVNDDPFKRSETLAFAIGHMLSVHAAHRTALPSPRVEPRVIRSVKEQLQSDLAGRFTLASLAADHALTPFVLLRAFIRSAGLSPHAYQQQARIRYAQKRLKQGAAIALVAREAGYADQAHFTRVFKQYTGATPKSFQIALTG